MHILGLNLFNLLVFPRDPRFYVGKEHAKTLQLITILLFQFFKIPSGIFDIFEVFLYFSLEVTIDIGQRFLQKFCLFIYRVLKFLLFFVDAAIFIKLLSLFDYFKFNLWHDVLGQNFSNLSTHNWSDLLCKLVSKTCYPHFMFTEPILQSYELITLLFKFVHGSLCERIHVLLQLFVQMVQIDLNLIKLLIFALLF